MSSLKLFLYPHHFHSPPSFLPSHLFFFHLFFLTFSSLRPSFCSFPFFLNWRFFYHLFICSLNNCFFFYILSTFLFIVYYVFVVVVVVFFPSFFCCCFPFFFPLLLLLFSQLTYFIFSSDNFFLRCFIFSELFLSSLFPLWILSVFLSSSNVSFFFCFCLHFFYLSVFVYMYSFLYFSS